MDPNWVENCLKELKMRLKQRTKEPEGNFTLKTPSTPVKSEKDKDIF